LKSVAAEVAFIKLAGPFLIVFRGFLAIRADAHHAAGGVKDKACPDRSHRLSLTIFDRTGGARGNQDRDGCRQAHRVMMGEKHSPAFRWPSIGRYYIHVRYFPAAHRLDKPAGGRMLSTCTAN
jgi:hypothetical protein